MNKFVRIQRQLQRFCILFYNWSTGYDTKRIEMFRSKFLFLIILRLLKLERLRDEYRLDAIDLFDPSPVGGQWIAMAVADHHTFVVLVAMLRVFVGRHMGKRCSEERNT